MTNFQERIMASLASLKMNNGRGNITQANNNIADAIENLLALILDSTAKKEESPPSKTIVEPEIVEVFADAPNEDADPLSVVETNEIVDDADDAPAADNLEMTIIAGPMLDDLAEMPTDEVSEESTSEKPKRPKKKS